MQMRLMKTRLSQSRLSLLGLKGIVHRGERPLSGFLQIQNFHSGLECKALDLDEAMDHFELLMAAAGEALR